jgi:hypothetical protein
MNQNLEIKKKQIVFGEDSVIIQKWEGDIKGGRALNWDGVTDEILYAGRIIITDGKGTYKPLGIESNAYKALSTESGFSYAGILYRSIPNGEAAAIMTAGQVNTVAAKNANSSAEYPSDFISAFPKIAFVTDEDANAFDESDTTIDKD